MPNKADKLEKFKKVRKVTFLSDYAPAGRVIYKKDSEHAIPLETIEKIKRNGGSIKIQKIDFDAETEKAKEEFESSLGKKDE